MTHLLLSCEISHPLRPPNRQDSGQLLSSSPQAASEYTKIIIPAKECPSPCLSLTWRLCGETATMTNNCPSAKLLSSTLNCNLESFSPHISRFVSWTPVDKLHFFSPQCQCNLDIRFWVIVKHYMVNFVRNWVGGCVS